MFRKIQQTIIRFGLLRKGDRVLIGVSGGKDSVSLLDILCQLGPEYKLSLAVAHLDHQLRLNSNKDTDFVRQLAKKYDVPFFTHKTRVQILAKKEKRSLEDAARQARYRFFEMTGANFRATKLALGHTLNDQIETFFMRLLRGAGVLGLSGIPIKRALNSEITLIRPLLEVTRSQIEAYGEERKLSFREDQSNRDLSYTRNKIRHHLLPLLTSKYNPNLLQTIARTQNLLHQTNIYVNSMADRSFNALLIASDKKRLSLQRSKFQKLDRFLQSLVLREAIAQIHLGAQEIGFDQIESLLHDLDKKEEFKLQWPGKLVLTASAKCLNLELSDTPMRVKRLKNFCLALPGKTRIGALGYEIECNLINQTRQIKPKRNSRQQKLAEWVDFDKIKGTLYVRTRRSGDRFKPLGSTGSKKLQDFFVDLKVPFACRDKVPLVCDGESIIWVVGYRISDAHRVDDKTKRVLKLSARMLKEKEEVK
jgi:tRNA(Ile)-lysidine synthase